MDNFNSDSMLDIFLVEMNELIDKLDDILLCAEKEDNFTGEYINEIFRIMHTIKGSSAMMKFDYMTNIAHKLEDMFSYIRKNSFNFKGSEDLFYILFDSCDFFKKKLTDIRNGIFVEESISELQDQIDKYLEYILSYEFKTNLIDNSQEISSEKDDFNISEGELDLQVSVDEPNSTLDFNHNHIEDDEVSDNYSQGFNSNLDSDVKENNSLENFVFGEDLEYTIVVYFDDDCGMEHLRAFLLVESIKDICGNISYYPENIENNPGCCAEILSKGFYIYLLGSKDLYAIENIVKDSINIKKYEIVNGKLLPSFEETNAHGKNINVPEMPFASIDYEPGSETIPEDDFYPDLSSSDFVVKNVKQNLVNVNLDKLDKLMDIVGEIVIAESIVTSNPEIKKLKIDNFVKSSLHLRKLISELQNNVMSIRMIPISLVFQKMNRVVRDMGKKLNKKVELLIFDEGTEVDKTIIDNLSDPIMHIVRNSMDHGIERSSDRIELGKSSVGKIALFAQNTGGEIVIAISDDGCGIDKDSILDEAESSGLLTKSKKEYTKKEIFSLILMPGFSTKKDITQFSGRGVGMDIVKKNIEKIGGSISIDSIRDKGTTIVIKIPITLAIILGLEICIGDQVYTIPLNSIYQTFRANKGDIIKGVDGSDVFIKGDKYYPIIKLFEMYDIPTNLSNIEEGLFVHIKVENKDYCVLIDGINGERQVVVKPLPKYLDMFNVKNYGIAGCTILGNGDVSLILDVYSLVEFYLSEGTYGGI